MTFWRSLDGIAERLQRLGIDVSQPGFYDSAEFMAHEAGRPDFISAYARYIAATRYPNEYLDRAERVTTIIANEMAVYGSEIGHRRCLDLAMTTGRMLEAAGVWNYLVRGAMFVELDRDESTRRILHAFGPMAADANVMGHVWLVVPPFTVVDVAAALQPWGARFEGEIPHPLLARELPNGMADVETMVDHDMLERYARRGTPITLPMIVNSEPGLAEFLRDFPPTEVTRGRVRLRYVPTATTVCSESFAEMGAGGGIPAHALWVERVRPVVEANQPA